MKNNSILAHFIKAPTLKVHSKEYPFHNFNFPQQIPLEAEFDFPEILVLGMQAEALFEAFLIHSKFYDLLSANLQIHGKNYTIGEIDYIVRDIIRDKILHIELACKFYLYDPDLSGSEEEKWIGPNRKDSLFEKLEKIKRKQFPVLHLPETIEVLKNLNIEKPSIQELCLKGFLFIPKQMGEQKFPVNYQRCIVGHWIRFKDFEDEDTHASYTIPNKKQWLLPPESMEDWYSFTQIKAAIKNQMENKKSPLVLKRHGTNIERFFVVWW